MMDLDNHMIANTRYGFSATRISELGASEYTLAVIAADKSGSVAAFEQEIEGCIAEVVRACRHSPRADNLLLRVTTFDNKLAETHGFKPLSACPPGHYTGCLCPGGATALYDATLNAVASVRDYAEELNKHGFSANAIVFVITDGMDNVSLGSAENLKEAVASALSSEALESVTTVLVGVNVRDKAIGAGLAKLQQDAKLTHYIELASADAAALAQLAQFVQRSISLQSLALGSGKGASLSF